MDRLCEEAIVGESFRTGKGVSDVDIPEYFEGTFGCGHEGRVSLENVALDKRFSRIRFLREKGSCKDCLGKQRASERSRQAGMAARWARGEGLPELIGSSKQIQFAEQVRHDLITDAWYALVTEGDVSEEEFEESIIQPSRVVTMAREWIDARFTDPAELATTVAGMTEVRAVAWELEEQMAPLQGSDRQVPWARRIRYDKITKAGLTGPVRDQAKRVNAAQWWISNADAPAEVLGQLVAAAGHDAFIENMVES